MSKVHVVKQGECLSLIAKRYGFADYRVLYNHADNAELKKKRPNPNVIRPGDRVVIPDPTPKEEKGGTEQTHTFRLKIPRKRLRIKLLAHDHKPLAGVAYTLEIADQAREGTTDGDGLLDEPVALGIERARLFVDGRVMNLHLGHLNPVGKATRKECSGVQGRLKNLGYDVGSVDGSFGHRTRSALAVFQADHDLEIDGNRSDATLKALEAAHGC